MDYFSVLYPYLFYFAIYSFLGWSMETLLVSLQKKVVVNRGFFLGPYCPVYGLGFCALILVASGITHLHWLFLAAGLTATVVELFIGIILHYVFHARWWNYSHKKFNILGLVCPSVSFAWAFLAVVVLRYCHPAVVAAVNKIPYSIGRYGISFFILLISVDSFISIYAMMALKKKAAAMKILNTKWNRFIDENKLDYPQNWITEFGEDFYVDEAKRELIYGFAKEYEKLQKYNRVMYRRIETAYNNKK